MSIKYQKITLIVVPLIIIAGLVIFFLINRPRSAGAAWWDDSWSYRQTITLTNNSGGTLTNSQIQVVVGTGALITAGKMRSDCGDIRFVDTTGKSLAYWNEFCRTGPNQNSSVWVTIPTLTTTPPPIYLYYGNAGASSQSKFTSLPTGLNYGDGADQAATVSATANINSWVFSGRNGSNPDGFNPAVTTLNSAGSSTITATSSAGLASGDEVIIISLQGSLTATTSAGLFETARVTAINGATLTINHPLVNTYDGTVYKVMLQRVPNYSTLTVCAGNNSPAGVGCTAAGSLTATPWSIAQGTGGLVMFRSTGTVTTNGAITTIGLGYAKGTAAGSNTVGGNTAESYDGAASGRGGNGASFGETRAGGRSGDGAASSPTASPNDGVKTGAGGGGGSDGSANTTQGGGGGGGGGGYAGGGGGGGGNTDIRVASAPNTTGTGGAGGAGGTVGVSAGGGGAGCSDTSGGSSDGRAGGAGGNPGSAGTTACNNNGAGAGEVGIVPQQGSGGGGVSSSAAGAGGGGGGIYGSANLSTLYLGSGGGGGGGANSGDTGADGGNGGGIIYISASSLSISLAGTIYASGSAGTIAANAGGGSGGGGAGGSVFLNVGALSQIGANQVSADGGVGGGTGTRIAGGGNGGDGRIHAQYSTIGAGTQTTAPTADASVLPAASSPASEEQATGPILYWKFDEGQGTIANDTRANTQGTLTGAITGAIPTWQTDDLCVSGKCLFFDGKSAKVTAPAVSAINAIKTISFWEKHATASASFPLIPLMTLNSTTTISITANGTVLATGSASPTIYVNGFSGSTVRANNWNHIEVTTATPINANTVALGNIGSTYLQGFMDDIKFYNFVRSSDQVKLDFNAKAGAIPKGAGTLLGAQTNDALSQGLVGYWKFDESSGNATDSSGLANMLLNNGTTTFVTGKFGNAANPSTNTKFFSTSTAISSVKTVAFWINPTTTTSSPIDLNGTQTITVSSGAITANNFTAPSYFVNGSSGSTLVAGVWQHVVVTTTASFNTGSMTIGKVGSNSLSGSIDEVRFYNRALSPSEVQQLYNFTPGPVGYWNFDEGTGNPSDRSGNGNNGTWNGTGVNHWVTGKYGKAGNFNGSDDYVNVSSHGLIDPTTDYTISAWINPSSTGVIVIYSQANTANNVQFLFFNLNNLQLNFDIRNDANAELSDTSGPTVASGVWSHVALVKSGSDYFYYLNGQMTKATGGTTPAAPYTFNTSNIGTLFRQTPTGYFKGIIDDDKLYSYARTPVQIVRDMQATQVLGASFRGPADWWKFDDGVGTGASSSGYLQNMGTLVGMASPPSVGTNGWQSAGKFGKAVAFPAVDGASAAYVDFGRLSYTENIGTMSAALWVNPNSVVATKCLLCKWNDTAAASSRSWAIETGTTNASAIRVSISTDGNTGVAYGETPAGKLTAGNWTHIAVVYDGSQYPFGNAAVLKIYVNGIQQTLTFSGTIPTNTFAGTIKMRAGASSDATAANIKRTFSGMIDEAKIYTGAITTSGVLGDYNHDSSVILGSFGTVGGTNAASSSATAIYCVPGDSSTCKAPIAEYLFEEGQGTAVNDTTGNGYIGSFAGTAPLFTNAGHPGKGGKFNGTDNQVNINTLYNTPANMTITAWVNLTTKDTNASELINIGNVIGIRLDDTTNGEDCFIQVTASNWIHINNPWRTYAGTGWHHFACTYDATNHVQVLYIDGVVSSVGSDTHAILWTGQGSTTIIGNHPSAAGYRFKGTVDNVRIYNYALSNAQVMWDMNRGAPQTWWKFDECSGTIAHDLVGTVSGTMAVNGTATAGNCLTSGTAWYDGYNNGAGKYNASAAFSTSANTDWASVTSASYPLSVLVNNNVSWGGWFYIIGGPDVSTRTLFTKTNSFSITRSANGNQTCIAGSGSGGGVSVTPNTPGPWVHFICTYDGQSIRTYLNGVLKNTTVYTGGIPVSASTLVLGDSSFTVSFRADDIKVWNYTLTPYQVLLDMNQAAGVRFGPNSGSP